MDDHVSSQEKNPQKGIVFAVFLLAIFSLVFGIIRLRQYLFTPSPLATLNDVNVSAPSVASSTTNDAAALQAKDTDADGLNDYDELNRYKTSPYLKDTDSDGFDDKKEIESANDPNCPQGKTCVGTVLPQSTAPTATNSVVPPFDPVLLRATLRAQGVSDEQLQKIDDATLRQLYDETTKDVGTTSGASETRPAQPSALPTTPQELLATASPQELRAFLKESGIAENILNSLDDATLRTLVLEALKESNK